MVMVVLKQVWWFKVDVRYTVLGNNTCLTPQATGDRIDQSTGTSATA